MRIIYTLIIFTLLLSCSNEQEQSTTSTTTDDRLRQITVEEVIQTKNYTYLRGEVKGKDQWIAFPKNLEVNKGDKYYFSRWYEMPNFKSKELDKTFESILFVEALQKSALTPEDVVIDPDKEITAPEGGITIEELLANKSKYEGETVLIKGVVVKFNTEIMNKNWLHLQDNKKNDITITTQDVTSLGEEAVIKGKVMLNQDFGAGYFYDIIIVDGEIINEKLI